MPSCSAPRPAAPRFALPRWLEIHHITVVAGAAVILVLAAVALRLVGIGVRDLFRDEAASWLLSRYPVGDLVRHTASEAYPPLYPLLLKAWTWLLGDSEVAMRLLSVLAGLVMLLAAWRWAAEALGSGASLVVLGLVALSPMAVADGRDVRMYALEAMFATLAWWFIWRLLHQTTSGAVHRRDQLLTAAFVAGELWSLAFGLPVAALQAIAVAITWLHARPDPAARSRARYALGAIIVGAALFVPWLPSLFRSAASSSPFWTGPPGRTAPLETFATMFVGTALVPAVLGTTVLLLLLGYGLDRLLRGRHPDLEDGDARLLGALLLMGILLIPTIWIGSHVRSVYDQRYFGAALAPAALAVAAGWTALVSRVASPVGGGAWQRWRLRLAGVAVPACVVVGSGLAVADSFRGIQLAPSNAVMHYLQDHVRVGDAVIAIDARSYFPIAYLADRSRSPTNLPGPIWYWRSPGEPAYDGGSLVPAEDSLASSLVNDPRWPRVIPGLRPGGHVWLVALANGDHDQIDFAPLRHPGLYEADRIFIRPGIEVAQIRRLDQAP
jgi:4-amino-4-deoxy-L-arabinose transferase-like glycosyltransferase